MVAHRAFVTVDMGVIFAFVLDDSEQQSLEGDEGMSLACLNPQGEEGLVALSTCP